MFRHKRTVASYQAELEEKGEEVQRCLVENAQLRAERQRPEGIRGLFMSGVLKLDGMTRANIKDTTKERPGSMLFAGLRVSFRSSQRVAVALKLRLQAGGAPWSAAGAALVDAAGRELPLLPVWQSAPVVSGAAEPVLVVVEAEASPEEAQGPFILKLWDAAGERVYILEGVTFPVLP